MDFKPPSSKNVGIVFESSEQLSDMMTSHKHTFYASLQNSSEAKSISGPKEIITPIQTEFKHKLLTTAAESNTSDILITFMESINKDIKTAENTQHFKQDKQEDKERDAFGHNKNRGSLTLVFNETKFGITAETRKEKCMSKNNEEKNVSQFDKDDSDITDSEEDADVSNVKDDLESNAEIDAEWLRLPFLAVEKKRTDVLALCCQTGVDLNKLVWNNNMNMLMYALSLPAVDDDIAKSLINHFDLNNVDDRHRNALGICLRNTDIEGEQKLSLVQILTAAGVPLRSTEGFLCSALHEYIFSFFDASESKVDNWKEIVDELLKEDNVINVKDWIGQTVLMHAVLSVPGEGDMGASMKPITKQARDLKLEVIEYLLKNGADPNMRDDNGRSCIHLAAVSLNIDVMRLLLRHNCSTKMRNDMGMTAIYTLCSDITWYENDQEIETILFPFIQLLIDSGCGVNTKAIDQTTVLHFAAAKLPSRVCEILCSLGADVSAGDYLKRTPLHMTARNKDCQIVRVLKDYQADVNAADINNDTPLHHACLLDNFDVTEALIECGAEIKASGRLGIQPIHLAAENGNRELISYLVSVGIDIHAADEFGARALHYAASDGNADTAEILLELGADKNERDKQGFTPLQFALYRGHLKVATILSNSETDVRFGKLPIRCFPNRPLLNTDEVDAYFGNLIKCFLLERESGLDLTAKFLTSAGFGCVDFQGDEAKLISEKVIDIAQQIVDRIGELDSCFESKLLRAGSTHEGVKTGYPDEFDFVCDVHRFSTNVERVECGETTGFAKVIVSNTAPAEILKYCIRSDNTINAAYFQRRFVQLARQAMFDVLNKGPTHIYSGYMLLRESYPIFGSPIIQMMKLNGLTISFRGKLHKHIDVSIDLNPVIFSSALPEEAAKQSFLLPDLSTMGIYLIPKHCVKVFGYPQQERMPLTSDLWRYSTHHMEASIMQGLSQLGRNCYSLCKLFRMEPLTCSVKCQKPRVLSEKELQELFPIEVDDDEVDDDSEDASETDVVLGDGGEIVDNKEYHKNDDNDGANLIEVDIAVVDDDGVDNGIKDHTRDGNAEASHIEVDDNEEDADKECDVDVDNDDEVDTEVDNGKNDDKATYTDLDSDIDNDEEDADENLRMKEPHDVCMNSDNTKGRVDKHNPAICDGKDADNVEIGGVAMEKDDTTDENKEEKEEQEDGGGEEEEEEEEIEEEEIEEEDDELTAEHAIPSYYLKSIFIKEIEEMAKSGEDIKEEHLTKLPRRVYETLARSLNDGFLATAFMPSHNMYQRSHTSPEVREMERMREVYCRNILRLMEAIDIK